MVSRAYEASRGGWTVAIVLGVVHLAAFTDRYLIALVAPVLKADLRLSDFQIGLLQGSAFVLTFAVGALIFGSVADRSRRVLVIAASLFCWSAASAAFAFCASFGEMFLARVALGLGQAALSPAALSLIAATAPHGRIGQTVSIYTSGSTLGRSAAFLGGGALLPALAAAAPLEFAGYPQAWRGLFVASVIPNLVLVFAVLALREPARPARRAEGPDRLWRGWLFRRRRRYAAHIAAAGAATMVIQAVTAWTITVLVRRDGYDIAAAGTVFGLVVLAAGPAGHLTGGALLDALRRGARDRAPYIVLALSLVGALPAACLFCLGHGSMAIGGLLSLTYALGLATPAGFAGLQTMTPRAMRGRASALFLCCITLIGFGLGPPLVGFLTDRIFGDAGAHLSLLSVVACGCTIGFAVCAARMMSAGPHTKNYVRRTP